MSCQGHGIASMRCGLRASCGCPQKSPLRDDPRFTDLLLRMNLMPCVAGSIVPFHLEFQYSLDSQGESGCR